MFRTIAAATLTAGLGLVGAALLPAATGAATPEGMVAYQDKKHGFSIAYPAGWKQVAFQSGPDFHVLANDGKGPEECNVNVAQVSGPAYLRGLTINSMRSSFRQAIRDAELTEWRRGTLGRRDLIGYVVTSTVPPREYKQTTVGQLVVAGATLYTVSCSAPTAVFEQRRTTFEKVLGSLDF